MPKETDSKFIPFTESIEGISIPSSFTYPFNYEAHPLAQIAATELQHHINTQKDWVHNFGLQPNGSGKAMGKMFGVLVVKNAQKQLGYLAAFSGVLADQTLLPHFVPPIYDRKANESFYVTAENKLNAINKRVSELENSERYASTKSEFELKSLQWDTELKARKSALKQAKANRRIIRNEALQSLSEEDYAKLNQDLDKESMDMDYAFKRWVKSIKLLRAEALSKVDVFNNEITRLKDARKALSASNQHVLFSKYQMLNIDGEAKGVPQIFDEINTIPPAGAGDCAAPKLLQYAFQNDLTPIALAEFWWGAAPQQEILKHGYFYPSCKSKCEPILGHMLTGMKVDKNPRTLEPSDKLEIKIIFEDEHIAVINKPAELLSVPGKKVEGSVFLRMKKKYPKATGPLIVHRLDQSTSGIMLIAKSREAHKNLQQQFEKRSITKHYVAILDGVISGDEGEIDLPLRVDLENRPRQMVCFTHGKNAHTQWKVLSRENGQTKVLFIPTTGRTHQLRVHAAHTDGLNTSILGDDIYGKKANRLHLHAQFISFTHPITNTEMEFKVDAEF